MSWSSHTSSPIFWPNNEQGNTQAVVGTYEQNYCGPTWSPALASPGAGMRATRSVFRDNFAGHVLRDLAYNADFTLGWIASPLREGATRGLFTEIVPSSGQFEEAKFSLITLGAGT